MKKVIMTLFALLLTGIFIVFKLRGNEIGFNNVIDKNNLITVTYSEKDIQYIQDRICLGGIDFSELKSYYKIQCLRKTFQGAYVILRQDNGKEAYVFINEKGKVYGMLVIDDFKKKEEFERNISVGMTRDELFAFDATSSGIPVSAVEMTAHLVEEGAFVVRYKREFGEELLNEKTSVIESIEFIDNEELKTSEPSFYYVLEIDKYESACDSDDVVVGIPGGTMRRSILLKWEITNIILITFPQTRFWEASRTQRMQRKRRNHCG